MGGLLRSLMALGPARLAAIAGAGLAVLGLVLWLALRASTPPMGLLYAELDQKDAGQITAALERQRVPYRLEQGGAQILVPLDDVAKIRLALARDGLPSGGSVGYEIFDRGESLTTTPFQQDVNRLRALEGELARSVRTLSGVRSARIHLVLPRREPFSRDRGEAQASVVLSMQGSQRLDRDGVQAVLHLVATAVPGLKPQNVSIVDSRGELLARGGQALAGPAVAQTQEEMRRAEALRISRSVEEMLERTLGAGRVRAEATVEMDFDRVETREERFDPDNQVARSQQSVSENNRSSTPGSVSVANNLPNPGGEAGGGGSQENRQEETTNYEIGRTTRNVTRDSPVMKRLSVAVLVDGVLEPGTAGSPATWRERSPEELQRIGALVKSAVGYDERRGDRVEVVNLRFAAPEEIIPAVGDKGLFGLGLPPTLIARLGESALYALVALLAIFLVGRPLVTRLGVSLNPKVTLAGGGVAAPIAAGAAASGQAVPAVAGPPANAGALPAPDEDDDAMVSLASVQGQMKASSLRRISELVDKHPDEALSLVRNWMSRDDNL